MIKTLARVYRWNPTEISELYLDGIDFYGIEYWYNDAVDQSRELEKSSGK